MTDLPIALIVAAADNGVIGHNNTLPWNLPADLAHFKRQTLGKPVLMGRLTHESIGRPLPGRANIVISRDPDYRSPGVQVVDGVAEALTLAANIAQIEGATELMVIGGAQIYALAMPKAQRIYLTRVHLQPPGDAYLPAICWDEWRETDRREMQAEGVYPAHTFLEYTRIAPRVGVSGR